MFDFFKELCYTCKKEVIAVPKENKEQRVYEYIRSQIEQMGYPPSIREICAAVGLSSPSTVHGYLKRLAEKGLIIQNGSKKRAISLPERKDAGGVLSVPVVGTVAAGTPILATQNITDTFPVPESLFSGGELFMLKVKGDSMINAGILDGDFVVVKKQATAENGQMVVALLSDSATVKTFYRENGHIRLQPENDALLPIITDDAVILGVVSGVFRKY